LQEESRDAVTLITLHAAKGLEFPIVFIVGMDEGSLPHSRSVSNPEQLEEERRLAYVGFTRAMKRLYLVRARRRSVFGETQYTEPSRFLADIPQELIITARKASEPLNTQVRRPARSGHWEDDFNQDPYDAQEGGRIIGSGKPGGDTASRWSKPAPRPGYPSSSIVPPAMGKVGRSVEPIKPAKPKVQQFKPGDRVRHNVFGEGLILKSEMDGQTEFVEVQFQGKQGKKNLSLDFAKLEKLN
jgi:DNA helicase-2/ATP-dependent DNA helicase PcrA